MEGQRVPGSLQSITDSQPKYNGNGLKITVFVQFRPFGRLLAGSTFLLSK